MRAVKRAGSALATARLHYVSILHARVAWVHLYMVVARKRGEVHFNLSKRRLRLASAYHATLDAKPTARLSTEID